MYQRVRHNACCNPDSSGSISSRSCSIVRPRPLREKNSTLIADHHAWYGFIGKSVVCCPDSLLDGSVVSLGFRYMIAGVGVVHDYI